MINIIINTPLYFTSIIISLIYIYWTRTLVVGNGFWSSLVEHCSSVYNPEDDGWIPSRKALELHFSHFSVWRFLDDTFLMIVHWKGISMQRHILASSTNLCIISEFDHSFFLIWTVWFWCFRCDCCFDSKQHRLYPRPPCLISIPKTFIDLCFVFKQLASLRKLKETCDEILNKLKLVASCHKPSQVGSQTTAPQTHASLCEYVILLFILL